MSAELTWPRSRCYHLVASTTTKVLQEVGTNEAPGPADLLPREDPFTSEREKCLGADAKKMRCLLGR